MRYHWFAGTGMAHGLRLREGKAEWFRSRFILDRNAARVLNRKPLPGPGEGVRDANVNTNLINVGGKLCAIVEAGPGPLARWPLGIFPRLLGIPVHRAVDSADMLADPQLTHLGHFVRMPPPLGGDSVRSAARTR